MKKLIIFLSLAASFVSAQTFNGIVDADGCLVEAGFISTSSLSNQLDSGESVVTDVPRGSITKLHDSTIVARWNGSVWSNVTKTLYKSASTNLITWQAEQAVTNVIGIANTTLAPYGQGPWPLIPGSNTATQIASGYITARTIARTMTNGAALVADLDEKAEDAENTMISYRGIANAQGTYWARGLSTFGKEVLPP